MPTYTLKNNESDEYFDTICTYNELQEFLENNTHCSKVITAPNIISGNAVKTDGGFKDTMSRIADAHPNSPLAERYGNKQSHNTIKVKNVAKKHKLVDIVGQNVNNHYEKNKSTGLY